MNIFINKLTPQEFIELSKSVGWGVNRKYNMNKVKLAIEDSSFTVSVEVDSKVVGCARAFSDDLLKT